MVRVGLTTFLVLLAAAELASAATLPLHFEANDGQTDSRISYLARAEGYVAYLAPDELLLRFAPESATDTGRISRTARDRSIATMRVKFAGAAATARLLGSEPLTSRSHYFLGADSRQWVTNVPHFGRIECKGIYPGIDLVYSGKNRRLQLEWVLAPGVDPGSIRLQIEAIDDLNVDDSGDLVLQRAGREFRLDRPLLYQEGDEGRQLVQGRYEKRGPLQVGFRVDAHDETRTLVIDPILSYSSYLGGADADLGLTSALGPAGELYLAGESIWPGSGSSSIGTFVAYVAKLNATGQELQYETFLGGTDADTPQNIEFDMMALAVDGAGFAYLVGDTSAANFPMVNAAQSTHGGLHDGFVVKLAPAGSPIVYSTYLGGSDEDLARGVAVDAAGNVFVTGLTLSSDFPVSNALQPALHGVRDAFLAKLDPSGSSLLFSTYLGGSDGSGPTSFGDLGYDVAADASGDAYLAGYTSSPDFPLVGALQPALGGGTSDAFVAKIARDGSALLYSTYIGGSAGEECLGLAVDQEGSAYITGWTSSDDFPVTSSSPEFRGAIDAYVAKLAPDGRSLLYSTYIGGSFAEYAYDISVNQRGEAYVTGVTSSQDFPVVAALQPLYGGGPSDAFVTALSADGASIRYSTFLGGSGDESYRTTSMGIASSRFGGILVTGTTDSPDFPIAKARQSGSGGSVDAFLTKIDDGPAVRIEVEPAGNGNVLLVRLVNGGLRGQSVELKLWLVFSGGTFSLYPTGVSLTLPPKADLQVPDISLPSILVFPGIEVHARLLDAATGEVLSATTCASSPCR